MDNNKIMIVGTGNVGASIAFAILNQKTAVNEIILTDIIAKDAEGEAMDLRDALTVAPSYIKIKNGTYADAKDCDIVVITAGAAQKQGESRLSLLKRNANIIKGMVGQIMESGFNGIFLVISNPVDILSYLTYKFSGLPAEKVIGSGTILDSSRLSERIASVLNVHPKSVHAYQVGEHGDSSVSLWSSANMGGQNINNLLPQQTREDISTFVRNKAYDIIEKKGATYYGIATCAVQIIDSIFNDENRVIPVSTYDNFSDVYYGFPAIIGRNGIVRKLDLALSEHEKIALQKSINELKKSISTIDLQREDD